MQKIVLEEIGKHINLLTGFPFKSSGYTNSGIRLLRGANVKRGKTDWSEDITKYWKTLETEHAKYKLEAGDLVIAMDGSLVGRSFAKISVTDIPALLLQRVARIRSTSTLDAGYLSSFIGSDWFTKHVDKVKTTTAIPHISPSDIKSFAIPIPSTIAEQQAIASTLSAVDALLAKFDQLIAKKRDIKQAAMQELLTGRRRLPGFSAAWAAKRIDKVAPLQRGFDLTHSEVKPGPYPVAYSNGIANHHAEFKAKGPGIATGRSGTIGNVHYIESDYWPHNTSLFVTNFHGNDPKFVYYLFQHTKLAQFSTGSGVPTLNRNDVHAHVVQIPQAHEEQSAIAQALTDMDTEITQGNCTTVSIGNKPIRWLMQTFTATRASGQRASPSSRGSRRPAYA